MFTMKRIIFGIVFAVLCVSVLAADEMVDEMEQEVTEDDMKNAEYAKGSLCGYCGHCKFCSLCDEQCPCDISPSQPNCNLCKYCKYCYLCSSVCDTICQPGSILDRVTAAIVGALPSINTEEVDVELDNAKEWMDKKNQEMEDKKNQEMEEDKLKDEL